MKTTGAAASATARSNAPLGKARITAASGVSTARISAPTIFAVPAVPGSAVLADGSSLVTIVARPAGTITITEEAPLLFLEIG